MKKKSFLALACLFILPDAASATSSPIQIAMPSWDSGKYVA
ncbi:hypothetical protein [Breoghania sp.]|nr:hypothetical protein [Breoghania sp.]